MSENEQVPKESFDLSQKIYVAVVNGPTPKILNPKIVLKMLEEKTP